MADRSPMARADISPAARATRDYSDPRAIAGLVRDAEVHRDIYTSQAVYEAENRHLFRNVWMYLGHASQCPNPGDYVTDTIAGQPLLMVRGEDGAVRVFYNRCPHKGTRLTAETCGHAGKHFRCPYHAWTFRTDGALHSIPLRKGYEDTGFEGSHAERGLTPVAAMRDYREFVFVRLADDGVGFEAFFGESLSSIDNMIDRSPEGRLVLEGAPSRYMHKCNWKMLVENQTDTCHPMVAHESSAGTAVKVWEREGSKDRKTPMAVQVYAPFMAPYEFFERMGMRIWPNGHGHTGVTTSIHADYSEVEGYEEAMRAAYGEDRAMLILSTNRHNTVYFPNIMVKGPVQTLRVFKPLAADRTLVESFTFRLVGAPDILFERTLMYNRLINAPTSIVGHDDLEMYERAQEGLHADGYEWVNVQRLYEPGEENDAVAVDNGTTERQMRNQFRAWKTYMLASMTPSPEMLDAAE